MTRFFASMILCALFVGGALSCAHSQQTLPRPTSSIGNLHRLTDRLYSGGEPVGEDAYGELASLGIRAVVSVDAVAPDRELAQRFGIRVIHLPIGYDGIPEDRTLAFAKIVATINDPIYIHCHHGKHRGPAALVVGAIGAGEITNARGAAYLGAAGTSDAYPGLWEAVRNASRMDRDELRDQPIHLPARAQVGGFAETMSEIDRAHELLWLCADNGFAAPDDHPDLAPASLAGQIHNQLRSLRDDPYTIEEGGLFRALLEESITLASSAESAVTIADQDDALDALARLGDSCVDCHSKYRD